MDECKPLLGGLVWWTIGYPIALGDIGGVTKVGRCRLTVTTVFKAPMVSSLESTSRIL